MIIIKYIFRIGKLKIQNFKPLICNCKKIQKRIYELRGQKVMFDFNLAELYNVEVKHLKQTVRRNKYRFPEDFMIVLTNKEYSNMRSQIVTSCWGGTRYLAKQFI